jgi:L-seryl-tRNA(Ser) seleniumtransferase
VDRSSLLQQLPSVDELLSQLGPRWPNVPHEALAGEIRRVLDGVRRTIRGGGEPEPVEAAMERALQDLIRPSLRRVINATGVVLHTNLGRAPLESQAIIAGYSNLEYDIATGRRGKRDAHAAPLLERLLGSPAIVVNNNAAAVFLALNELAAGFEVVVSRGELIEIGDGFRIPDIMARSGAILREVGTTNRTHLDDYRAAITDRTRLLMRVHPSNFRIEGFTARPVLSELVELGRERNIPVYEDLGSGCLVDLRAFGIDEPLASDSLRAGADLISFSGDKLMGGPQAGIMAGKPDLVASLRRNPMFRPLRVDKLIYQALENTLRNVLLERWEQVPALAMIRQRADEIRRRAERISALLPGTAVIEGASVIGGGSTPQQSLPTWLIAVSGEAIDMERHLRHGEPPVIARIQEDTLLLDLRTVFAEEEGELVAAVQALSR